MWEMSDKSAKFKYLPVYNFSIANFFEKSGSKWTETSGNRYSLSTQYSVGKGFYTLYPEIWIILDMYKRIELKNPLESNETKGFLFLAPIVVRASTI